MHALIHCGTVPQPNWRYKRSDGLDCEHDQQAVASVHPSVGPYPFAFPTAAPRYSSCCSSSPHASLCLALSQLFPFPPSVPLFVLGVGGVCGVFFFGGGSTYACYTTPTTHALDLRAGPPPPPPAACFPVGCGPSYLKKKDIKDHCCSGKGIYHPGCRGSKYRCCEASGC